MRIDSGLGFVVVLIGLSLVPIACRQRVTVAQVDPNGPVEVVIPEHGAYTGAFMDFGDAEDDVTLETIEDFEQMVGKHQAIIASSSYWGEQNFPADNLNVIWRHGSLPLVFWSPWDRPYEEDHGPDKFSLTEILAGRWDAYIDRWADGARSFGWHKDAHPAVSLNVRVASICHCGDGRQNLRALLARDRECPKFAALDLLKRGSQRAEDKWRVARDDRCDCGASAIVRNMHEIKRKGNAKHFADEMCLRTRPRRSEIELAGVGPDEIGQFLDVVCRH